VDVTHQGRAIASKKELQQILATTYKVNDPNTVFVFGFKTQFGGGKSTGFGLIYDNLQAAKKYEPKHRLVRVSIYLLLELLKDILLFIFVHIHTLVYMYIV
jgi:small subunit ribosomal protein S24e